MSETFSRVLKSGWYVLGPEHDNLESELASFVEARFALGCANGTDALQIALRALGVSPADTVVTAANAGGYTTTAARLIGASVAYADIDSETHLLTVKTLKALIDALPIQPKVIVVTHLYGAAAPVTEIVEWAHGLGIAVVEDCAQALGAFDGQFRVGSVGDVATTSFYPTKNLGALGDGGAIFTNNPEIAEKVVALRQYGWTSKYHATIPMGTNSRLDELQAAFLRIKLGSLDEHNDRRRLIHSKYSNAAGKSVRFVNQSGPGYVGHLAVIEVQDRDLAIRHFESRGVSTAIHYPVPDHLQLSLGSFRNPVTLPNTELLAQRILSLPLFPELTDREIEVTENAISELG
jgi:dTDP-4-amino-4,6-dideoxygalactose transaminase